MLIPSIRKDTLGNSNIVSPYKKLPQSFNFLGGSFEERVKNLSEKVIPSMGKDRTGERKKKQKIFEYIMHFLEDSFIEIPYLHLSQKGLNLAKRPFLVPTTVPNENGTTFAQQYRWDTYFQNKSLLLIGAHELAKDQLLNLTDCFTEFKRIPNALASAFLSHAQPPLEIFSLFDLINHGSRLGSWTQNVIRVIEEELFTEWLDYKSGKEDPRQSEGIIASHGYLTRYTNLHLRSLLAGCEDGKDHNYITISYGSKYLPVQLNAIIYGIVNYLQEYYTVSFLGNNANKAEEYSKLKKVLERDFQHTFWCEKGKWIGFRNYSLIEGKKGHILYGDLAAEVWPLFVKIATSEQARITKDNLEKYYKGDYGLAATSLALRKDGSIPSAPDKTMKYQWEYPNCWPPLMYIAVQGLKNYGYHKEAQEYEKMWVSHVEKQFYDNGFFYEKTIFSSHVKPDYGLYGNRKGFGWTIATYLVFLNDLVVNQCM